MVQDPSWLTATIRDVILYHTYSMHLLQWLSQALFCLSKETWDTAGKAGGLQNSQNSPCATAWPDSLQWRSLPLPSFTLMKAEQPTCPSSLFFPFSLPGQYMLSLMPCLRTLYLAPTGSYNLPFYIILKSLHLSLTFTMWNYYTVS